MKILIVRLGALGDIVHAIPAAAALRAAFPDAQIDWLVDARHRAMVDLVTAVDRSVVLERPTLGGWAAAVGLLRRMRYDAAIDLQGLLKSAVLARASGARRVIGFSIYHLREKTARPFYSATDTGSDSGAGPGGAPSSHVIYKNLRLLRAVGVDDLEVRFPLADVQSRALDEVRRTLGGSPAFALINPGAAWPNKQWHSDRYGEVAAFLHDVRRLPSFVLWGPGEEGLARAVAGSSSGAARVAPPTSVADLLALSRAASLIVSGDTGPLHIATAAGTPAVAIFGPTDPDRNGPWHPDDVTVSRYGSCGCHYQRRCRESSWCLSGIPVSEVTAAVQKRLIPHAGIRPDGGRHE